MHKTPGCPLQGPRPGAPWPSCPPQVASSRALGLSQVSVPRGLPSDPPSLPALLGKAAFVCVGDGLSLVRKTGKCVLCRLSLGGSFHTLGTRRQELQHDTGTASPWHFPGKPFLPTLAQMCTEVLTKRPFLRGGHSFPFRFPEAFMWGTSWEKVRWGGSASPAAARKALPKLLLEGLEISWCWGLQNRIQRSSVKTAGFLFSLLLNC